MTEPDQPSYLPRDQLRFFEPEEQPLGGEPSWVQIHHIPLTFQRDEATGRWWALVTGARIDPGTIVVLGPVELRVWLSALPRHEPEQEDPVLCNRCDPPAIWPCPPAKARLLAEYEGDRAGLAHHLAKYLCAAGWSSPRESPRQTYERIVGWTWEPESRRRLAIR